MFKSKPAIIFYVLAFIAILSYFALNFSTNKLFSSKNDGKYNTQEKTAVFHGTKYAVPGEVTEPTLGYNVFPDLEGITLANVLGSESKKDKRIEIDLSSQKLYAYEGSKKKMDFDVSTGKWGKTPTGEFRIYTKLKYTLMTGGSKAINTYYYLPNVPYTMYFYKDFGIHGAYWHNNFGHPMSHGCVNMKIADSEKLFYWANPVLPDNASSVLATKDNTGTPVIIYGTTPAE